MYSLASRFLANTGQQEGDKSRGITQMLFIDMGSISADNCADEQLFFDELVRKSKLSKGDSQKVFVLQETEDIQDASEADKEGSLNQGFKMVLLEGKPAYKIKFFGGSDLLKRLRKFNGLTVPVREYDSNTTFWGTTKGGLGVGFKAKLNFKGNKAATGQNVEEGVVELTISFLSVIEYFDNAYWMELPDGANVGDITPLIDVTFKYVSHASNVVKYSMKIIGSNLKGGYSVGPEIGTLVAALYAQFSAKSGAGTPSVSLPITSMAYDATNDLLAVTYDATAYGTAAGNILLQPPTPAQLDTGTIPGTEMLAITHVKP